jgi:hypothetical protein
VDWARTLAQGQPFQGASEKAWDKDVTHFFDALARLDELLASNATLAVSAEQLFQGPIADALTHIGQISLVRRLAGSPVKGENYFKADIAAGRVGPDQSAPRVEFD